MEEWCVQEGDAQSSEAGVRELHRPVDRDPESDEEVARAAEAPRAPVPVLDHGTSARRHHEGADRGDVERRARGAARAAQVDRPLRAGRAEGKRALTKLPGERRPLLTVRRAYGQRHEERAAFRVARRGVEQPVEHGARVSPVEPSGLEEPLERRADHR